MALSGGSTPDSPEVQCLGADMVCLAQLLDLSLLKFQERDALVEAVHKYRKQVGGGVGREARGRSEGEQSV